MMLTDQVQKCLYASRRPLTISKAILLTVQDFCVTKKSKMEIWLPHVLHVIESLVEIKLAQFTHDLLYGVTANDVIVRTFF